MTSTQYDQSNSVAGPSEGVTTITSGSPTSWTSISLSAYNLSNTTSDASDGYQIALICDAITESSAKESWVSVPTVDDATGAQ